MCLWCNRKSNTLCYYFILAAFIFSVFISIANFAKLKGSLNIRLLQVQNRNEININAHVFCCGCIVTMILLVWGKPILNHFYLYISYYPNAFSHAVNTFIPKIFESSPLQLGASNMLKMGDTIISVGGGGQNIKEYY